LLMLMYLCMITIKGKRENIGNMGKAG